MNYHIKTEDGITIASFLHSSDRDYCIETLRDIYDGCKFDAVDEG